MEDLLVFQAFLRENQLVLGDPESPVAYVCGWTRRDLVAERLAYQDYCAIGQLYSAERGIDILVRNLLANPSVTRLVVCGVDLSGASQALVDFFRLGFEPGRSRMGHDVWRIKSPQAGYVGKDIPYEVLQRLRSECEVLQVGDATPSHLRRASTGARSEPRAQPAIWCAPPETAAPTQLESEGPGHVIRGDTVAQVWLRILARVSRYGHLVDTSYEARSKEILDLVAVVARESGSLDELYLPDWLGVTREQIERYFTGYILSPEPEPGVSYTYGSRMRSWFKQDQIAAVIRKLTKEADRCKSAVISLWDPTYDNDHGGSPCFNHLWFRLLGNKLHLTVTIRSNDMFDAWPKNALAARLLQADVARELGVELGPLVTHSLSAHFYEESFDAVETLITNPKILADAQALPPRELDPRGNILVNVTDGKIVVTHLQQGEPVSTKSFPNARSATRWLVAEEKVSQVSHALYLGQELEWAEQCLKSGLPFVQDQAR